MEALEGAKAPDGSRLPNQEPNLGEDAAGLSKNKLAQWFAEVNPPADKKPTNTPAFKAWFGDSKVVDENGEPLVVYHGTQKSGFTTFDEYRIGQNTHASDGFYFTESRRNAATYSNSPPGKDAVLTDDPDSEGSPGIYPVYLPLQNPLQVDFEGRNWDGALEGDYDGFDGMGDWVNRAKQDGHDGLIANNVTDEGRFGQGYGWGNVTFIAFRPEQIKSAIGNVGTFDKNNPDIRMRRGPSSGMTVSTVREALAGVMKKTRIPIRVVQSAKELPFDAPDDAKGVYFKGKIWAVADNLSSPLDAEITVARHEVTHAGIDWLYGSGAERERALRDLQSKNPKLREIASGWRVKYGKETAAKYRVLGRSPEVAQKAMLLDSMEEAAAYFAQEGNTVNGLKAFFAIIQKALRARGYSNIADMLEEFTKAEVSVDNADAIAFLATVHEAVQHQREGAGREQPAFHRAYHGKSRARDLVGVVEAAKAEGNENATAEIGLASPSLVRQAMDAGIDIAGYRHTIDAYAVRHSLDTHGGEKEAKRGQIPLTEQDILSVPDVVKAPDVLGFGAKNSRGQDLIVSVRRMPDGTMLVIEEVRTGLKTLALTSVRKHPAATDVTAIARTVRPNARGDGGDLVIIPQEDAGPAREAPEIGIEREAPPRLARREFNGPIHLRAAPRPAWQLSDLGPHRGGWT